MPRSSFEVVEPEFFLQLLVSLLTDPARLDGAGEHRDRRVGGKVGRAMGTSELGTAVRSQRERASAECQVFAPNPSDFRSQLGGTVGQLLSDTAPV